MLINIKKQVHHINKQVLHFSFYLLSAFYLNTHNTKLNTQGFFLTPHSSFLLIRMFVSIHIFDINAFFLHSTPGDKDIN